MVNRKWAYRELFDSEEEAARAYDGAVWRLKPKEAKSYVNFKERPGQGSTKLAKAARAVERAQAKSVSTFVPFQTIYCITFVYLLYIVCALCICISLYKVLYVCDFNISNLSLLLSARCSRACLLCLCLSHQGHACFNGQCSQVNLYLPGLCIHSCQVT